MIAKSVKLLVLPLVSLFLLTACTVQLVPSYDAGLVQGLNDTNEKTQVLFSSVSNGPPASSFSNFESSYDEVIGKFNAIRMQAEARDVPEVSKRLAEVLGQSEALQKACGDDAKACINSSPASIKAVVNTLEQMKKVHSTSGLAGGLVKGFSQQYEIDFSQALFVETSLQRSGAN